MKVQCPTCREIVEMKDFLTSSQGLTFACTSCHQEHFLQNPKIQHPAAPQTAPPEIPTAPRLTPGKLACPKCGHVQEDEYACHQCGLVFSKFDADKLPAPPKEAVDIWEQAAQNLFNEKLHEDFIKACMRVDRLDYAVRQYRLLSHSPGYEEIGKKMLALVSVKGQAQLPVAMLSKKLAGKSKKGVKTIAWILVAVVLALAAYYGWSVVKMLLEEKHLLP